MSFDLGPRPDIFRPLAKNLGIEAGISLFVEAEVISMGGLCGGLGTGSAVHVLPGKAISSENKTVL